MKQLREKYLAACESELFEGCIPFWLKYGRDGENGGIFTCLDRTGRRYSTDKSVWMQGRAGWMFARLCNAFGKNDDWLALSKSCIDFENAHCFDADGRMYFTVTADGRPLRKRRYMFSEAFYAIACAEYYLATGDQKARADAERVYNTIVGIYRDPASDPFKIFPKTFRETRDMRALSVPMILFGTTAVMMMAIPEKAAFFSQNNAIFLSDIERHYDGEASALLENITPAGADKTVPDGRIINPGHSLECAWFIAEEAERTGDKNLVAFAEKIYEGAIKYGLDGEYGGLLYFVDACGYPPEAYEHDMKLWWTHAEAVNASLALYKATGKREYADKFEYFLKFSLGHFSDPAYGEWFGYLRRDGKPTEPPSKGHIYKGPFHVMRMLANVIQLLKED